MADFQEETLKYHRRSFSTLVLVQAAVLLASAADPNVQLNRAVDQIRSIERAVQDWDEDWMQTAAVERLEDVKIQYPAFWPTPIAENDYLRLRITGAPIQYVPREIDLRAVGASFSLRGPNGVPEEVEGSERRRLPGWYTMGLRREQPETLAAFRTIWNGLNDDIRISLGVLPTREMPARLRVTEQGRTTVHITSVVLEEAQPTQAEAEFSLALLDASAGAVRELSERVPSRAHPRGSQNLVLIPVQGDLTQTASVTRITLGAPPMPGDPPGFDIEIAIDTVEIPLALQETLRARVSESTALGSFDYAFAELADNSQGIEALPIADLRAVIETRLRNMDRTITIIGLEFPVGSLALWGAGLLVLAQLYFLIGFQHLSPKLNHDDTEFPWIAFFDGALARTAFSALAFVTPVFVVLLAGWPVLHARDDALRTTLMALLVLLSASAGVSGVASYRSLLSRLRRKISEE